VLAVLQIVVRVQTILQRAARAIITIFSPIIPTAAVSILLLSIVLVMQQTLLDAPAVLLVWDSKQTQVTVA
jgi:hypothetical protein